MVQRMRRVTCRAPLQRISLGVLLACTVMGCDRSGAPGKPPADDGTSQPPPPEPARIEFDLFAFGRVLGTVAPCGCTTEPLGGLQYAFGFLTDASHPGAFAVVEPGSFLFPDPEGPEAPRTAPEWAQADRRADALQARFAALGPALVSGVGPTDVVSPEGVGALVEHSMPRVLANRKQPGDGQPDPLADIPAHRLVRLKHDGLELTLGVTAVLDPSIEGTAALGALNPAAAALAEQIATMRKAGADLTVAVAHGKREFAEALAREVEGVDIMLVGLVEGLERQRLGTPVARVGGAYVVEPGEQLQTVTRLHLSVAPGLDDLPPPRAWTLAPPDSALQAELQRVSARIEKFEADPEADPAFVGRLHDERKRIEAQLGGKVEGPAVVTFEQVKITCKLPVDQAAKKALSAYDSWIAESNKKRFAGVKPPTPPKGKAGYVGVGSCADCHEEQVAHWKTTRHAQAYRTLVESDKQFDLSCVGCHVTGFREPGGSEVVENEGLTAVQCEVCHGPGSIHADDPTTQNIRLQAPESICAGCHTPEHSDTFRYEAYLRDVLGAEHGSGRRERLGDGPTGRELRAAGLAKAGGACKKM